MAKEILRMEDVTKIYDNGFVANKNVTFWLHESEILALVGENGAGKTTLMKVLFGLETPQTGKVYMDGKEVKILNTLDAIEKGIGMVHQHFMLVESFTAAQNIILGMEPKKGLFVSEEEAVRFTKELSSKYNLEVEAKAVTRTLPVGVKQKIEILKALARGAEILILDEPTAVLAPQETDQLFEELIHLKEQGHTIVFISHKIPEIKRISDRITVMRAGCFVGCCETKDVTEKEISSMIMGCEMDTSIEKSQPKAGDIKIEVEHVSYTDRNKVQILKDLNFGVRGGMIFGIAGVQGNGQVELVDLMTKKRGLKQGDIRLNGKSVARLSLQEIRGMQFGYVPEDRMDQGIAGQESIAENMVSNRYASREFCRGGLLDYKKIDTFADENIRSYEIRCFGNSQNVGMLSGGNMQKVVVGKWLARKSRVVIFDEPTRGIDVGAKVEIYHLMNDLKKQGIGVMFVSSEMPEVIGISDRVIVMCDGRITGVFSTDEVSQDLILECATKFESKLDRTVKAQEPVRKCVETGGKHE